MAIDPSFLEELGELTLVMRKRVSNVVSGGRPSIVPGRGLEIADHREYFAGDDFRLIDWRVYGRTEKLYIRRFEEEKDMILHILLDASASMDFGTDRMKKFDYAGSIALGFSYLSVKNHEKFTTGLYSETLRDVMKPQKGKTHLFKVLHLLNTTQLYGKTNLSMAVGQYTKLIKSKSLSIIISDFIEPLDSLKDGIYRMARHSKDVTMIQILDPGEVDLRWDDDIKFEDSETRRMERTFLSPGFKHEYKERLQEHIMSIREICNSLGITFVTLTTDKPIIDAFIELVGGVRRGS